MGWQLSKDMCRKLFSAYVELGTTAGAGVRKTNRMRSGTQEIPDLRDPVEVRASPQAQEGNSTCTDSGSRKRGEGTKGRDEGCGENWREERGGGMF